MKSRRATKAGKKKKLTNPGLEALWEDERLRRATLLAGLIDEEDAESLSPPDSPPRNRDSDWKSDSQQFWEDRLANVIKQMEEKGMLDDGNDDQDSEDPDSTANYFTKMNRKPGSSKPNVTSDDPVVYPAEICDDEESQFLQAATALDVHVSSLSQTILATPEVRKPIPSEKNKTETKTRLFHDSVIDEEILSQTISDSLSQKEESESVQYFDEDEIELMDLLNELGKERISADNASATKNEKVSTEDDIDADSKVSLLTPKQILTQKQFEEDVQQTLEMSQIWDSDPLFDDILKV